MIILVAIRSLIVHTGKVKEPGPKLTSIERNILQAFIIGLVVNHSIIQGKKRRNNDYFIKRRYLRVIVKQ